jgi:hypothetical protein
MGVQYHTQVMTNVRRRSSLFLYTTIEAMPLDFMVSEPHPDFGPHSSASGRASQPHGLGLFREADALPLPWLTTTRTKKSKSCIVSERPKIFAEFHGKQASIQWLGSGHGCC